MPPIRICQLLPDLVPAGPERCVYELVRRLDRRRFDVQIAALRGGPVAGWLARDGIQVTVLGVSGITGLLRTARLTDLLRRRRIDLLHTHLFGADLIGRPAARLAAVPHVVHTAHFGRGRFRPWQFAYARLLSGYCDRIVCISEAVRHYHRAHSGLPKEAYTVIPNGVDADAYGGNGRQRRALRKQWDVREEQVVAGFVGRLAADKGIDTLLAAISHLGARGSPVDVVIAGDGPKRHLVENFMAHGEGGRHCRLLGFVDNVAALLSAVDMLVTPSRWEGWPLAVGEALAAGVPVIGSDIAGLRDLVAHEQNGLLVEGSSVVALSEGIARLAEDAELRRRLGTAGRQWIRKRFPIQATIAAYEALYGQIGGSR